ncbi:hypothetical protein JHW43_004931 [Diplocarpon mali]|nr:hypothetical protein JHW43_004931 [Diplocarpon mali]
MLVSILCQLAITALATASPIEKKAALPPTFLLAGDSTTAKTTATGGDWGDGFLSTLVGGATGVNFGRNGATTESFVANGIWAKVIDEIKKQKAAYTPYVTLQFGHNDQKTEKNISVEKYSANLKALAGEVTAAGGFPILVTPIARRKYKGGAISPDLAAQVTATLQVARDIGSAYIDLNAASTKYLNAIGEQKARTYDLRNGDATHLNAQAGKAFGNMASQLISASQVGNAVKAYLKQDQAIIDAIASGTYILPSA